jgi:alpha-1,6-mannosyltransferase
MLNCPACSRIHFGWLVMNATAVYNRHLIVFSGVILIGLTIAMSVLSPRLAHGLPPERMPILAYFALLTLAGGVYAAVALGCRRFAFGTRLRSWVLAVGLLMRLAAVFSTPVLENDHYRYLWDGAVVANGFNPYRYAPLDIQQNRPGGQNIPLVLLELAESAGDIVEHINYPLLRTIYPPVAQACFALAFLIAPFGLMAWRLVLMGFDLAVLWLIGRQRLPFAAVMIYWWNPLLVKETYNSGHLDIMLLPFLLLSAVASGKDKPILAASSIGLATGIKLWPIVLAPIALRPLLRYPGRLFAAVSILAVFLFLSLIPFAGTGLDASSGLVAYSRYWEMNDAVYMLLSWVVGKIADVFGPDPTVARVLPRMLLAVVILCWTLSAAGRVRTPDDAARQYLSVVAALFVLSPTQFPWYYLWLLPFLALNPNAPLILYTAMLPMYYLRPYFASRSMTSIFDYGIVWIQHGPILLLLIRQWWVGRKENATGKGR